MAPSVSGSSAAPVAAVVTLRRPGETGLTFLARRRSSRRGIRSRRMSRVAVVTDTTQYLPREVIERHGLHLVSLYVNWDGRTDRETDLPDFDALYAFLRSGGELPSTSQPSVGDFLAVYEPLIERGDDILSIHLSGGSPARCGAAEQARDQLIERGMAPGADGRDRLAHRRAGHGFMAVAAANAVEGGADLAGAVAAARRCARPEDHRVVDTLEFLRRGGRIGAAQAWIGSALKIKPILTIEGEITPSSACAPRGGRSTGSSRPGAAARERLRRLRHPARPGARRGRAPRRARPRDLRPRAGVHLGDRPGHRHPHRPGLLGVTGLRPDCWARLKEFRRAAAGTRPAVGVPLDPPEPPRAAARPGHPVLLAADHPPDAVHRGPVRALAVPHLPAAQAARLAADRDVPGGRALGPGQPAQPAA